MKKCLNANLVIRKEKSTTDCIFILHSIVSKVLNTKQKLYSVFIDNEKCYDKINRLYLWQKLLAEGINLKITKALKAMYKVVKSGVKYNGNISSKTNSQLGVKQRDPSSSLLFMMFVKGGILPRNLRFFYNNQEIEIVRSFSYLGIVFTPGGSFSNAQTTLAGQAQKAVFKLNSYLYKFADLTPRHVLDLFDKLVTPIICYCSEVWVFAKLTRLNECTYNFVRLCSVSNSRHRIVSYMASF